MISKIFGGLAIVAGIAFMFLFPDMWEYQSKSFSYTGITIGIILILLGIYLIRR